MRRASRRPRKSCLYIKCYHSYVYVNTVFVYGNNTIKRASFYSHLNIEAANRDCTPRNWVQWVNRAETAELEALRRAVKCSSPYGRQGWVDQTVKKLNLEWTLRPRGRPRVRLTKEFASPLMFPDVESN